MVFRDGKTWQARSGDQQWRCAVGRSGITQNKREGDGATPLGSWPLRKVLYRPDKWMGIPPEKQSLPLGWEPIERDHGWCDDPNHAAYNQPVPLPFEGSHERLWRDDDLYDIVGVMGYNDLAPEPGLGSAIFLHVATADYGPTEGCVALAKPDLLAFLTQAHEPLTIEVWNPGS